METPRARGAAAVVVAVAALAGCSPAAQPAPSAYTSTMAWRWSTPAPPTSSSDPWYARAYAVQETVFTWVTALEDQGGVEELPPELSKLLTGQALTDMEAVMQFMKEQGLYWDGHPRYTSTKAVPLTEDLPEGAFLATQACETTEGAAVFLGDGTQLGDATPAVVWRRYFFQYDPATAGLLVSQILGTAVETCPIG